MALGDRAASMCVCYSWMLPPSGWLGGQGRVKLVHGSGGGIVTGVVLVQREITESNSCKNEVRRASRGPAESKC